MRPEDALTELDNTIAMFAFMTDAAVIMTDPATHRALNDELHFGMQQIFYRIESQFKEIRDVLVESAPVPAAGHAPCTAKAPDIKQPARAPEAAGGKDSRFHGLNCFDGFADKIRQGPAEKAAEPVQQSSTIPA